MAPRTERFYVDNKLNRSLGRVGLPVGSVPHSKKPKRGNDGNSRPAARSFVYADNAFNRSVGRVGREIGTMLILQPKKHAPPRRYVDNQANRRLGRVGLEIRKRGALYSRKAQTEDQPIRKPARTTYVDSPRNRQLNRVGLPYTKTAKTSNRRRNMTVSAPMQNLNTDTSGIFIVLNPHRRDLLEEAMALTFGDNSAEASTSAQSGRIMSLPEDYILDFSDLNLGKKIGDGTFGEVYSATWRGEFEVAVKKLKVPKISKRDINQFEEEVHILSSLDHPSIVRFYGACITLPDLALVMEFMPAGSLYQVLHVDRKQLTREQKNNIIADALAGLAYVHSKQVVHRDIKSSNVMMCRNMNNCKLTDFGLALKDHEASTYSAVGTYAYCSPEVLSAEQLTLKELMESDVYSMATMIVEVLSEKIPFARRTNLQIQRAVLSGERPNLHYAPMNNDTFALLSNCLSDSGIQRPSALQLWQTFIQL